MTPDLSIKDIDEAVIHDVYIQDYSKKDTIHGVEIFSLKNIIGEEGDFCELVRLDEKGQISQMPGFQIAQVNRTKLNPSSIKAWHLHFKQDELWHVPPSSFLFAGLWDVRKSPPTRGKKMRILLGGGYSQLLFIPKGVAHGSCNFSKEPVELMYFVNKHFNIHDPDEKRIRWDILGADFWTPMKD